MSDLETLNRIVAAGRACFREHGVERSRMGHIAARAGLARQTLYDFVANKGEVVDRAIATRLAELGAQISETPLPRRHDIGERLVDLMALVIQTVGSDAEYSMLAGSLGERHAFQYLAGRSPVTEIAAAVFAEPFAEARQRGLLRTDVPEPLIVEWLQGILAMLSARESLDDAHVRTLLRAFALPAILAKNVDASASRR